MADYNRVSQLIALWGDFEKQNPTGDFASFGSWLTSTMEAEGKIKSFVKKIPTAEFQDSDSMLAHHLRNMHKDKPLEVQIPILVGRMNRYARRYIKKAYGEELSISLDEFQFLVTTASMHNPKKIDVISMNLFETTTGTEILRRLIKLKYIRQVQSKEDKRSKILSLTPTGEKVLRSTFAHMQHVGKLFTANLTESQMHKMKEILEYLNDFHANIYLFHKEERPEELVKQFIK